MVDSAWRRAFPTVDPEVHARRPSCGPRPRSSRGHRLGPLRVSRSGNPPGRGRTPSRPDCHACRHTCPGRPLEGPPGTAASADDPRPRPRPVRPRALPPRQAAAHDPLEDNRTGRGVAPPSNMPTPYTPNTICSRRLINHLIPRVPDRSVPAGSRTAPGSTRRRCEAEPPAPGPARGLGPPAPARRRRNGDAGAGPDPGNGCGGRTAARPARNRPRTGPTDLTVRQCPASGGPGQTPVERGAQRVSDTGGERRPDGPGDDDTGHGRVARHCHRDRLRLATALRHRPWRGAVRRFGRRGLSGSHVTARQVDVSVRGWPGVGRGAGPGPGGRHYDSWCPRFAPGEAGGWGDRTWRRPWWISPMTTTRVQGRRWSCSTASCPTVRSSPI
jgi:hypothetical protein